MSPEILHLLNPWFLTIFCAILSLVIWLIKRFVERVKKMEDKQQEFVTEKECREMIDRRLHPMQRQLEKVDEKLDKIIDNMLKQK